jgi:hypothetical protein
MINFRGKIRHLLSLNTEKGVGLNDIIHNYEERIKEINKLKENEMSDMIQMNEDLKKLIEEQKVYFENIIFNEKKSKESLMNDLENRENELLNEINFLHSTLNGLTKHEINNSSENNIFLLNQKIESLENYIHELKQNNSNSIASNNEIIQKNLEKIKSERSEFVLKIECLNKDLLQKSEIIQNMEMTIEQIVKDFKEKEEILIKNSQNSSKEMIESRNTIELYKRK